MTILEWYCMCVYLCVRVQERLLETATHTSCDPPVLPGSDGTYETVPHQELLDMCSDILSCKMYVSQTFDL